jgi:hypothetical protein
MKFRGNTYMAFAYYWGKHDGVADAPNIGFVHYTPLDYTDAGDPGNNFHSLGDSGREVGNTWGGLELGIYTNYSFTAPFLTADHFLFKDNHIKLAFHSLISPVHMQIGSSITFQPIAVLQFSAGVKIGTGWSFGNLFHGIGTNIDGEYQAAAPYTGHSFEGAVLETWLDATFQFDVSALMPASIKRWTHIVMLATPRFRYEAMLNIPENVPYNWEADDGDNLNGWHFLADFLLGYQIPIIEDDTGEDRQFIRMKHNNFKITVGMLLSIDQLRLTHMFDSPMASAGGWGSDFARLFFGPLIKFDLPNNFFAALMFHWRNAQSFTQATVGNANFMLRDHEDWYLYFYRVAMIFGWNF